MKAQKAHPQRETQATHQQGMSTEQMCSLIRQARRCIRTARALVRGTQPTVQHLHSLLRNHELSTYDPAQLGKETERLASVTKQLTTLAHAFANTVQNFLLEVTLQQYEEQSRIATNNSQSSSADDHCEKTL
jgi:hypothetical protein